jgi:transcriptional regulator GlxA family with amidase domain
LPRRLQRLLEENIEQQRMLEQLVVRLDAVERALQAMQEQRNKKSMFGGFLGPRGL